MYNADVEGREVRIKPREGIFELGHDGSLVLELGPARALAETLSHATRWSAEELSDEDPE